MVMVLLYSDVQPCININHDSSASNDTLLHINLTHNEVQYFIEIIVLKNGHYSDVF